MNTLSEMINAGVEAVRTDDALTCGQAGNAIVELNKGELDATKWPDISDEEWQRIGQNGRKLLVAASLFCFAAHSGPERTLTA